MEAGAIARRLVLPTGVALDARVSNISFTGNVSVSLWRRFLLQIRFAISVDTLCIMQSDLYRIYLRCDLQGICLQSFVVFWEGSIISGAFRTSSKPVSRGHMSFPSSSHFTLSSVHNRVRIEVLCFSGYGRQTRARRMLRQSCYGIVETANEN